MRRTLNNEIRFLPTFLGKVVFFLRYAIANKKAELEMRRIFFTRFGTSGAIYRSDFSLKLARDLVVQKDPVRIERFKSFAFVITWCNIQNETLASPRLVETFSMSPRTLMKFPSPPTTIRTDKTGQPKHVPCAKFIPVTQIS